MSQERIPAIQAEINRPRSGGTSFYYVDTDKAEKMGITQYKATVGDNFIRIIPPKDPKIFWARDVYIHRHIGANDATFLCLKKMFNKPCPTCELIVEMRKKDPDDDGIGELSPKLRHLMLIYNVKSDETIAEGLKWWDAPAASSCPVVESIISLSRNKRIPGAVIDVSDPVDGKDITFVRKGTGQLNTSYSSFELAATDPIPSDWYEDVPAFEEILLVPAYDKVYLELHGQSKENTEGSTGRGRTEQIQEPAHEEAEPQPPVETEQSNKPRGRRSYTAPDPAKSDESAGSGPGSSVREKIEAIKRRRAGAE